MPFVEHICIHIIRYFYLKELKTCFMPLIRYLVTYTETLNAGLHPENVSFFSLCLVHISKTGHRDICVNFAVGVTCTWHILPTAVSLAVRGKIRAAVGKAHLLISQKFKQFRELCAEHMVSYGPWCNVHSVFIFFLYFHDMLNIFCLCKVKSHIYIIICEFFLDVTIVYCIDNWIVIVYT